MSIICTQLFDLSDLRSLQSTGGIGVKVSCMHLILQEILLAEMVVLSTHICIYLPLSIISTTKNEYLVLPILPEEFLVR